VSKREIAVDEEQKQEYLEKYKKAKAKGVKFWPDIIYKDMVAAFGVFVLLLLLAIFVGVANEPPADPSDSTYIPRPEWYFLFLFELLKYFPGQIEWIGTTILPGIAVLALILLPFIDRNPRRHWTKRKLAVSVMSVIVIGIVALTIIAAVKTPPQEETEVANTISDKILLGQDNYSVHCVECHGPEGEGGEVKGVEGLEGVVLDPINSKDLMYTRTDETLYQIIDYGQPDLGMPPFGVGYGGELRRGEIDTIVTFMRYTWDDRSEIPAEVAQAGAVPELGPDEVPSYEIHIAAIVKRYCLSCHRPGKKNNDYFMGTYEEMMTSGEHTPNIIPGDLGSNTIRMLNREEIDAGGPMPPTKALKPELIDIFVRWITAGAPETAEQAAALSAPSASATPEGVGQPTPTP
jgi:mono/diheme cytochrome c family protein